MTATINPPTQAVADWCSVFLTQGTESHTSSVTFLKQLTVVAVSTITYMKNIFPEENYTVANYSGLKLRILNKRCDDDIAQFLSTSLFQAFDAFDKKYLHQLVLCFYEDECNLDKLLEYYVFEYTYNSEGVVMNIHSKTRNNEKKTVKCTFESIHEQTIQLLRSCTVFVAMSHGRVQPSNLTIRLYYNDDAPEGYQAPGYQSCDPEDDHLEPTLSKSVRLGKVETPYHKLVGGVYVKQDAEDEAVPTQNPATISSTQQAEFTGSSARSMPEASGRLMRCPCHQYEDYGNYKPPALITCDTCGMMQHAACFGLLPSDVSTLQAHTCELCADTNGLEHTDVSMATLSLRKRESLATFRRALEWLRELRAVSARQVADRFKLPPASAGKLMKLFDHYEIVQFQDGDDLVSPKKINPAALQESVNRHFTNAKETLADRLYAETMANSQESIHSDPVGDVLNPMEKITLQNTANIGRVIVPEVNNNTAHCKVLDETLKQYREAIRANETTDDLEELPLSGAHNPVQNVQEIVSKTEVKASIKRKVDDDKRKKLRSANKTKKLKKSE